ncbi:molybdopterin/thiamine biosynthesis adenylyltransferase/rhodanese-related sulfurtransferase [Microbacterium sp. SORGH_AS 1204]|uniref:ThiF family adenylyltransferase n=1 Tax=Microbacterium sp. SORGH_AS_1204 TaxID=3041785 RepID=UPI0027906A1E|nr:ThiF family adenylyltransferase [Microbacterium sp. SORGH_AS_1204]MDQ1137789.1 molybdopterin/thiamine biosynthesis adenylyltransferase/rhodanese-related sulfurtransferase [Microbacterium sp. SORGH_AS_1204]
MVVSGTTTKPGAIPLAAASDPSFEPEELARYSRQITMVDIGRTGQSRLKRARVLVVGAGGLGSPVIAYLARAGVGTIGIIDHDTVARSNLHRQIIHGDRAIGRAKVESAGDAVRAANPYVRAIEHNDMLGAGNAELLFSSYDLVIDGTDDYSTRYLIADTCQRLAKPCVWGTVLETDGQLSTFWTGAPGGGVGLRDLYPEPPEEEGASCARAGVIGPLCGVVASWMAVEAMKLIVGFGAPLFGRLLVIDGRDGTSAEVAFTARGDSPPPRPALGITWVEPAQLRDRLDSGATLIDVREPWERDIAVIPDSVSVPLTSLSDAALPAGPLIFHCHYDTRARRARAMLAGREDVSVLRGGINAWATDIDPTLPRY